MVSRIRTKCNGSTSGFSTDLLGVELKRLCHIRPRRGRRGRGSALRLHEVNQLGIRRPEFTFDKEINLFFVQLFE